MITPERGRQPGLYVVFDGPPSHESGRFVELEDETGTSVGVSEWRQEGDFWALGPFRVAEDPARLEANLRRFLWLHHGHDDRLYGDDGEMQCFTCAPDWDYRRMPLATLIAAAERGVLVVPTACATHTHVAGPVNDLDRCAACEHDLWSPCHERVGARRKHDPTDHDCKGGVTGDLYPF